MGSPGVSGLPYPPQLPRYAGAMDVGPPQLPRPPQPNALASASLRDPREDLPVQLTTQSLPVPPMSPAKGQQPEKADESGTGTHDAEVEEEDWEPLRKQPYSDDMSIMGRLRAIAALEGYPPDGWVDWIRWTFASWARKSDLLGAWFSTQEELESYSRIERMCVIVHTMIVALFAYRLLYSTTSCSFGYTNGIVSDENGKQFYTWVPGLFVPVLRVVFLTWLIKLIFMKPMVQGTEKETQLSVTAHAVAFIIMIASAAIAGVMLFNGPPEEDPCGAWVFKRPSYTNVSYWFCSWLASETIYQYCIYVIALIIMKKYRQARGLPSNRKEYQLYIKNKMAQMHMNTLMQEARSVNCVGNCIGRVFGRIF